MSDVLQDVPPPSRHRPPFSRRTRVVVGLVVVALVAGVGVAFAAHSPGPAQDRLSAEVVLSVPASPLPTSPEATSAAAPTLTPAATTVPEPVLAPATATAPVTATARPSAKAAGTASAKPPATAAAPVLAAKNTTVSVTNAWNEPVQLTFEATGTAHPELTRTLQPGATTRVSFDTDLSGDHMHPLSVFARLPSGCNDGLVLDMRAQGLHEFRVLALASGGATGTEVGGACMGNSPLPGGFGIRLVCHGQVMATEQTYTCPL